ncbi:LysR family transcriptional regulator [Bacillus sp. FJAT-29790]|uniref:LysR family transcriptional regulator n=1 Tax=Bacillus sp. FJAT-29790 TaxID=1895002 RepID=UPI001C23EF35|nr:LysR family transcriptional regulator [Bacillus sp. FJAT-29790]MBU8881332.1 LysR family transcriptional regulator [Bacillus sp. FJAT-29790]
MDERDWLIIHTLYQEKNITNTGKALYISQPTLTKRLQQIETELGVKVVNRGVKGVQFTPEGEYLAKRAAALLDTFREIKEDVDNFNHYIAGTLRLGVSNFISKYKLPGWLTAFEKQYPDVEFQVETGYSKQINHLAYNQDIHIGFIRGDYNWPEEKELLFEESLCIASIYPIDLEDLPNLPRIDYQTDLLYKHLTDNWWAERYSQPPLVRVTIDRGDTCKEMVLSGLGYAILPSLFLKDVPHVYQIPLQTKEGLPITQKTWMIYHKDAEKLNVVKAFVDFIKHTA